jgi:hypothetical protein
MHILCHLKGNGPGPVNLDAGGEAEISVVPSGMSTDSLQELKAFCMNIIFKEMDQDQ